MCHDPISIAVAHCLDTTTSLKPMFSYLPCSSEDPSCSYPVSDLIQSLTNNPNTIWQGQCGFHRNVENYYLSYA